MPVVINLEHHLNRIDDEIVVQIRRSRFLVADLTGCRGGVYFEAGFAMGLGLPVIWTCKETSQRKLHFDVNHFPFLWWNPNKCAEFRKALALRIERNVGRGPHARALD